MIFLIDKSGSICYKSVTLEKMGSEAEAEHRHRAGPLHPLSRCLDKLGRDLCGCKGGLVACEHRF